jgi:transposase InsO family protein
MTRSDRSAATVLRLCQLAQLPRVTYYRSLEAKAPRAADMEMRSLIHAVSLANRHYGYRRITHTLRRQGVAVNGKRVQRLMREDNLIAQRRKPFIPPPSDRGQSMPQSGTRPCTDRARPDLGRRHHLCQAA